MDKVQYVKTLWEAYSVLDALQQDEKAWRESAQAAHMRVATTALYHILSEQTEGLWPPIWLTRQNKEAS